MTRLGIARFATAILLAGALSTACTSSTSGSAQTTPAPSVDPAATSTDTAGATDGATDTGAASDTAGATDTATTSATSSAPGSATSTHAAHSDSCPLDQLTVRVLLGSGAQQQEFAVVTFTNAGTTSCTLTGFPGVSLRRHGALLGTPATHTPLTVRTIRLAPGDMVQSTITDFSSCQAPLSDTVRVYPPDSTQFIDKPVQLRGCRIVVDPVSHA